VELTFLVVAALGWAAGRSPQEAVALVASVSVPVPFAAVVLALALRQARHRRPVDHRSESVLLLVRLAAALRGGATLRTAIGEVAATEPDLERAARLAAAGRPITEVVDAMRVRLGRYGDLTGASIRMASASGGALAPVVEQLVVQAMALDDLHRERRAAMAPGLLQAVVVGGVPASVLVSMVASGRLVDLIVSGPFQAAAAVIGTTLVIVGVALVARIASGSRR
jgi:hypothetical protein